MNFKPMENMEPVNNIQNKNRVLYKMNNSSSFLISKIQKKRSKNVHLDDIDI